jgi:hypothetical protein
MSAAQKTCNVRLHFIDLASGRTSRPWFGMSDTKFDSDPEIQRFFGFPKSMTQSFRIVIPTRKSNEYVTEKHDERHLGHSPLCTLSNYAITLAEKHKPPEAQYALGFIMHSSTSSMLPSSAEKIINRWRFAFEKPSKHTSTLASILTSTSTSIATDSPLRLSDAASLVRAKYDQYKSALSTAAEPAISVGDFVQFALPLKDHAIFVSGPNHQAALESLGFKFTPLSHPNCYFPEHEACCTLVTPSGTHGTMCIVDASGV